MSKASGSFTLPKSRLVCWLTNPGADVPTAIRARLIAGFFTSSISLIFGALANMAITIVAVLRHHSTLFVTLLVIEILLLVARLSILIASQKAAREGRPTSTDVFILTGVAWAALIGTETAACLASGDPTLQFLGPTTMMGIVCGLGARNYGAPRLAILQIILCDALMQFVIPFRGDLWMMVSFAQFPLFIFAVSTTINRLNGNYMAIAMAERESERRATHDMLTGLLNRAGLLAAFSAELYSTSQNGQACALLYLDLDGFKTVNDRLGHAAGDELLRQVAARVVAAIPSLCKAGRMGGDEFVILAPSCGPGDAEAIAETVIAKISLPYALGPETAAKIGVSVGVACAAAEMSIDNVLAEADAALYRAKLAGKGRCVVATGRRPERTSNQRAA